MQHSHFSFLDLQYFIHYTLVVFGRIVGPVIRIRPNSDNHVFGTALIKIQHTMMSDHKNDDDERA